MATALLLFAGLVALGVIVIAATLRVPPDLPSGVPTSGVVVAITESQFTIEASGTVWQARADEPIALGARVRVIGREGLVLRVIPEVVPQTRGL